MNPFAKYLGKEDHLQIQVATYLNLLSVFWTHVPNEGRRTKFERFKAKNFGIKSGVPDVLVFESRRGLSGLAIELKVKPNKPTRNQKAFGENLQKNGWRFEVCYSFDEAKKVIDGYLKRKGTHKDSLSQP